MDEVPGMSRAIDARRAALDLSPTEFAKAAGLTPEGLAPVRRGERRRYLAKTTSGVARALCWPNDWYQRLLNGENPDDFPTVGEPPRIDELNQLRAEVADLRKEIARLARVIESE